MVRPDTAVRDGYGPQVEAPWGRTSEVAELAAHLDWTAPSTSELAHATAVVTEMLADEKSAVCGLSTFYATAGPFAGLTFTDLAPNDPTTITTEDLLALTLMDVSATSRAVRRLLVDKELRPAVDRALVKAKPGVALETAAADELAAVVDLYLLLKERLGSNPWVIASKLTARKRPALFPVRDNVVVGRLGLINKSPGTDLLVFRHLVTRPDIAEALQAHAGTASRAPGVPNLLNVPRLRLLDTVLWMRDRRPCRQQDLT